MGAMRAMDIADTLDVEQGVSIWVPSVMPWPMTTSLAWVAMRSANSS